MNRIPHEQMAFRLQRMIWSKETWLREHGTKRPRHEVEDQEANLAALKQASADYERAAKRDKDKAA